MGGVTMTSKSLTHFRVENVHDHVNNIGLSRTSQQSGHDRLLWQGTGGNKTFSEVHDHR